MDQEEIKDYKKLFDEAKTLRSEQESIWQQVYDFCYATPIDVVQATRKMKANKVDSTGILLLNQLTNHLAGSLTNPLIRWFRIGMVDHRLNKIKRVNDWCEQVSEIIIHHINQSNFYDEIKKAYRELGATGNVGFYIEEGTAPDDDLFNCSTRGIYEFVILEDRFGKVQTVIRSPMETGRKIINRWGKGLPKTIFDRCEKEPTKRFRLLHVLEPRKLYDAQKKDKKNKPIKSLWIFHETNDVLEEGGYDDMPFAVGRLNKDASSEYGVGFGVQGLRELQTLNSVRKDTLKAKALLVNPPLKIPDGTILSPATIAPGQNILYRPMPGRNGPEPLLTGSQPHFGDDEAARSVGTLKELFFADALQVTDTRYESARGVEERAATQNRLLAGTVSELQNDLFERIVLRFFNIAARRGLLPPAPPEIVGKEFRPVWLSPLALRSKEATLDPLVRSIQTVRLVSEAMAAQIEGLDVINKDNVIRRIWDANGAPSDCLYDSDEVAQMRQARMADAQDMQSMEQTLKGVNALADAEAKTANTNGMIGEAMRGLGKAVRNGI